ncbi:MAG TPA: UDP-N-acetylglucosamine 2-epimerase (non-hydrolyzing) [Stellaceae bacterium]|nr:UDP-N-acetylglucosamine 2-epimerase (non-hydrolyzing) [Stellaceae bacterium]
MKILSVFGTRPEAIKMAPLVRLLARAKGIDARICVTGQHRAMLDSVLDLFDIHPDYDLDIMGSNQGLAHITTAVLEGVAKVIGEFRPDHLLVHGDTSTAFAAALAGYYGRVPVAHVEAGLRTGDIYAPYPEEMNRRLLDAIATTYFAPTATARAALLHEGKDAATIHVTGNTVIDALLLMVERLKKSPRLAAQIAGEFPFLDPGKKLVLVTGHRRENFGAGFERICQALATLAERSDVQIVYPVHLNPNVQEPVRRVLANRPNIRLILPQDYLPFVYLMTRAHLILTDSGGIQEEAPSLGKPVLVMREVTERPEAVAAGTVRLVGTDPATIVEEAAWLLDHDAAYRRMSQAINPYGDGHAAERIAAHFVPRSTRQARMPASAILEPLEEFVP